MKIHRKISLLLVFGMLTSLFIGCTPSSPAEPGVTSPTSQSQSSAASTGDDAQPVTLRFMWWGGDERHRATLDAIAAYMGKYPNVTIEAEYQGYDGYRDKLTTQLAGGTTADIIQFDYLWRKELAGGDVFIDYNQYTGLIDLSQFDMSFVEPYGIVDGRLFGLPTGLGPVSLVLKKSVGEKFGLDISRNWTWEDFISEGKKVNGQDPDAYFFTPDSDVEYEQIFRPYVIQLTGKQFINDDYTIGFEKQDLVKAFDFIKRIYTEMVAEPPAEAFAYEDLTQNPKWHNGQMVAAMDFASMIDVLFQEDPEEAVAIMPPVMEGAKDSGIVCPISQLLCVPQSSANVDEAIKFVNAFLNDPDLVRELKTVRSIPCSQIALETLTNDNLINPTVEKAVSLALSNPGLINNEITENDELTTIAHDVLEQFRYDRLDSDKAADELIKRFNNKLEELKQLG